MRSSLLKFLESRRESTFYRNGLAAEGDPDDVGGFIHYLDL